MNPEKTENAYAPRGRVEPRKGFRQKKISKHKNQRK